MLNDYGFAVGLLGELKWENFVKLPFVVEAVRVTKETGWSVDEAGDRVKSSNAILFFCPENQEKPDNFEFMVDISPDGELYFTMQYDDTVVFSVYSDKTVEVRTDKSGSWSELPHDIISDHSSPSPEEVGLLDFTYPKWRKDLQYSGAVIKRGIERFKCLVEKDGKFRSGSVEVY